MKRRLYSSWLLLIAGIIACDVANDRYWCEVLAGLLFLASWMVASKPLRDAIEIEERS